MAAAMMPGPLNYNTSAQQQPMPPVPLPAVPQQPSPYGSFTAPDPSKLADDPRFKFDLGQQQQAIQRSAAARGTLLTPGLLMKLQENASGVAGQHYGDLFNQDLAGYRANQDTYGANTNAALGYGRLGLESQGQAYGQARDAYHDQQEAAGAQEANANAITANQHQTLLDTYAQSQAAARQALMAPQQPAANPFRRQGYSPGAMRV